jgi:hypothetical protein
MRRLLSLIVILASFAVPCFACMCDTSTPVCEQIRRKGTNELFVGTVDSIRFSTREWLESTVKVQEITFAINDAMDSGLTKEATMVEALGSCAHRFEVGETYLVDYGRAQGEARILACGHTMRFSEAREFLRMLETLRGSQAGAALFGTVKQYVEPRNFVSPRNKPIPNALIRLETILELLPPGEPKHTFETNTDSQGWYQFTNLPAGDYTVSAELPAQYEKLRTYSLRLDTNGCSQIDLRTSVAKRKLVALTSVCLSGLVGVRSLICPLPHA